MVGLSSVLLSGLSGLRAAQTGISVVSQNIANANTPGYVRAGVVLSPLTNLGVGSGVYVEGVKRAADRFLASASLFATAAQGSSAARADLLSRAQASFGDPASTTSTFAMLDNFWTALTELGVDPASTLRRSDALSTLQATYGEIQRTGQTIQDLIAEADARIAEAVDEAQSLIDRIADLNNEIRLSRRTGADTSNAESAQSALIDQLSELMDVRATSTGDGGVEVRTAGGGLLVGVTAAQLRYAPNSSPYAVHGAITINAEQGVVSNLEPFLTGGSIHGLLQARDKDLPGLAEALGGFAGALGDALNQVHNENTSFPAPSSLTGRQTGLLSGDLMNFTGSATIGVTDANGVLRQRLTIDFDARTITGAAPATSNSFAANTIGSFASALNAALGAATPAGGASFVNGALSLNVGSNGGLVVQQDAADPSARGGRGFSHFFGLNDLITRPSPMIFETGLQGTDAHGFNAGGGVTYRIRDAHGRLIGDRTISISGALAAPGSDNDALVAALNANGTGLGGFGAFTFDSPTGRINFAANAGFSVELVSDTTQRGATGVSLTALHGLSPSATAGRAVETQVNASIAANVSRLGVGRPDLSLAIGERVLEAGDNRGANALLTARDTVRSFGAAGIMSAQSGSLASYAARLGGEAGRMASDADRAAKGAAAIATAAADRRAQVEAVSVDDELMKMTTFQNAYAASARVIQAAQDMLDVLMAIGYRS